MTKRTFNPAWESAKRDTKEARRLRKAAHDKRKRERMAAVNAKLVRYCLTIEPLFDGILDDTIRVEQQHATHSRAGCGRRQRSAGRKVSPGVVQ